MAITVTYDNLSAMTDKHFVKRLVDNFFLSSPLLFKLRQVEVPIDGGDDIRVPIQHSKSQAAKRWGGRAHTFEGVLQDIATLAVFPLVQYIATIAVPKTDLLKNMGKSRIVDLLKAQAQNAEDSLIDTMGVDAFLTGASSEDSTGAQSGLAGLTAVLTYNANPTSGAYGGISRASSSGAKSSPTGNAFWNGNVAAANANTSVVFWTGSTSWDNSTVLTTAKMQTMFQACVIGSRKPNLIVTSVVLYNKYWSLLTAIQQQMTDDEMGKIGFDSLLFNFKPVVVDTNINAATSMYFLNTETFELKPHKDMNFTPSEFRESANQHMPIKSITWMGNMVCFEPRANGLITALTA